MVYFSYRKSDSCMYRVIFLELKLNMSSNISKDSCFPVDSFGLMLKVRYIREMRFSIFLASLDDCELKKNIEKEIPDPFTKDFKS